MTLRMLLNPRVYAQSNYFQARDGLNLIREIAGSKKKKLGTILDLGCGPGNVTRMINEELRPQRLVAFDYSRAMIKEAKNSVAQKNDDHASIEFHAADGSADFDKLASLLKLEPNSVDLVYSNYCIHWVPPRHRANLVSNIQRFLKPGGDFYLQKLTYSDLFPVAYSFINTPKWSDYLRERLQTITGYELNVENLEEIFGSMPLQVPAEDFDREAWAKLFTQHRLYLENSKFCRSNLQYWDLEMASAMLNTTFWRQYVGDDRIDEFNEDYDRFITENYLNPKIEHELFELQANKGYDAERGPCKFRFNYIYTLFHGKKLFN